VWHCGATGIYSDEPTYNPGGGTGNVTTTGEKFLRGCQITDSNGQVNFTTIYPGCWPFYLVLALYTIARAKRHDRPLRWLGAGGVFLAVGLSLGPVLLSALFIDRGAQSHVIVGQPSLRDLVNSLHLGMIAGFTGGASLLAHWCGWRYRGFHFLPAPLALVVGWWLCQPLGMFLFSWITGTSVFVPRYLFLSLP
jgi:hypothetical protein